MTPIFSRRKLLRSLAGGAAAYAFAPVLHAANAATVTALGSNVSVLNSGGVNVVVAIADSGVALVDTGPKAVVDSVIEQLRALATSAKYTVFNTHWHTDQTAGNDVFRAMNADIIAHKKTFLHLSTDRYLPSEARYKRAVPKDAWPTETFYKTGTRALADETIDFGYLPQGHTDADIYVHFRNANVIAAGDIVSPERDPELDWFGGGWLGGRVDAMDILLARCNDTTQIVPAYGPVMTRPQLQLERDMMAFLYEQLVEQVRMGFSAQDSFESGVMNGLMRTFNDPQKFLYDAHKGLWAHHNKLAPNVV